MKVMKFSAPWCTACTSFQTTFEQAKNELSMNFPFIEWEEVNVDANPQAAALRGIAAIPATVIEVDGVVVEKLTGNLTYEQLTQAITNRLV